MERTEGAPTPPLLQKYCQKTQERCRCRQASASALPGDIAGNRVHICTRSCSRPLSGSPERLPGKFQGARGTGSAKTRKGARATHVVLALSGLPPPWGSMERTEGVPRPPLL